MRGLLEAANRAFQEMKSPKDVFFLDLDHGGGEGEVKVMFFLFGI